MTERRDIAGNRRARKWSRAERAGRLAWTLASPLFRCSPRVLWGWRRLLLRAFGARIGARVHICPTVRIAVPWTLSIGEDSAVGDRAILYGLGPIRIGERVTISQHAHLCGGTHDWRDPGMPLVKAPIAIADDAWVCADAFVGPGVTVGRGAIVAARACVMRDVGADCIAEGNPAGTRPKTRDGRAAAS